MKNILKLLILIPFVSFGQNKIQLNTGVSALSNRLDSAYNTVTQINDSTYTICRFDGTCDTIQFAQGVQVGVIGDSENGGGNVLLSGSRGFITIPYNCIITNWYISANLSGTIQFDIKRSGTSIIGAGNKPALSSALSANAAVSGWTSTSISAGDIIEWVIDSSPTPATLTQCAVTLKVIK